MTPNDFRELAMVLPNVTENSHLNHPDFRIRNRIFATLNHATTATIRLTSAVQQKLMTINSEAYCPASGKWGERGWTTVDLKLAEKSDVRDALIHAWRQLAPKTLLEDGPHSCFE